MRRRWSQESRGAKGDRRPGVTFEHVDYNCDLCRDLPLSFSLSSSPSFVSLYSHAVSLQRALIPSHPVHPSLLPLLPLCHCIRARGCRWRSMIEHALGYYYRSAYWQSSRSTCGSLRAHVLGEEDRVVPQVHGVEKWLLYSPVTIRAQYQLNKT